MEGRERAYIGLGANVGPARTTLERAITAIGTLPGASLRGVSRLYRTRPVSPMTQADFLNAVAALDVPADPDPERGAWAVLVALKGIERALGRHERTRWGPREIDLDLLLFGARRLRVRQAAPTGSDDASGTGTASLEVPHPRAVERLFVLAPLADLDPGLEPPGWGMSVVEARDRALEVEGPEAIRAIGAWDPIAGEWKPVAGERDPVAGE